MNASAQACPAWTANNPGLFIFWMKTGASQAPAEWIDEDALDEMIEVDRFDINSPSRLKDAELARTLAILDEIEVKGGEA